MSAYRKGDACLSIGAERVTLRLTLGALAEIEDRLGGGDFSALTRALERPSVSQLMVLIEALSAGGGRRLSAHDLQTAEIDLGEAAGAVAKAFAALSSPSLEKGGREPPAALAAGLGRTGGFAPSVIRREPSLSRQDAVEDDRVRESPPFSREGKEEGAQP